MNRATKKQIRTLIKASDILEVKPKRAYKKRSGPYSIHTFRPGLDDLCVTVAVEGNTAICSLTNGAGETYTAVSER